MIWKVLAGAIVALALHTGSANANLVVNGSFETNSLAPGAYRDLIVGSGGLPGWSIVGIPGTYVSQVDSAFAGNPGYQFPAQEGRIWLDLAGFTDNAPDGVRQSIATVVGQRYEFSFWLGNITGPFFGTQSLVNVNFSSGGTDFSCVNTTAGFTMAWQQCSQTFTAASAVTTFTISNGDPTSDYSNAIDNVVLKAVAGVPEPATWAMMLIGFAGLGLAARRRERLAPARA
jgi:hypothetical protein